MLSWVWHQVSWQLQLNGVPLAWIQDDGMNHHQVTFAHHKADNLILESKAKAQMYAFGVIKDRMDAGKL